MTSWVRLEVGPTIVTLCLPDAGAWGLKSRPSGLLKAKILVFKMIWTKRARLGAGGNYVIAFWTVIFMLLLRSLFKENSLYSQTIVHSEKQHALKNQAMALLAKSNDLQRKLDLKKRQAAALTR